MRRCHELQRIEQKMQTQKHLTVGGTQREIGGTVTAVYCY